MWRKHQFWTTWRPGLFAKRGGIFLLIWSKRLLTQSPDPSQRKITKFKWRAEKKTHNVDPEGAFDSLGLHPIQDIITCTYSPENTRHWATVGSMLGRWPNIEPTMIQCLVFDACPVDLRPGANQCSCNAGPLDPDATAASSQHLFQGFCRHKWSSQVAIQAQASRRQFDILSPR